MCLSTGTGSARGQLGFRADVIEQFPNRYRTMMQRGDRLFLDLVLVTGSFPVLPTHPEVEET